MRIQISIIQTPFIGNPIEDEALELRRALIDGGHTATLVRIPFQGYPEALAADHLLAGRLLAVPSAEEPDDLMIALDLPAALAGHPNKVLWLAPLEPPFNAPDGSTGITPGVHEMLRDLFRQVVGEARAVYSMSAAATIQIRRWTGIDAVPCFPPPAGGRYRHSPSPAAYAADWAGVVDRLLG